MKWLFLVHRVQTPNSRERVRVWRMTKKVGAILYRNSVYVLPHDKERLEDFQWLAQQIRDSRGEASVFVSESESEKEDRLLRGLFDQAKKEEYDGLAKSIRALRDTALRRSPSGARDLEKQYKQLQEEFMAMRKTDFFGHPLAADRETELAAAGKMIASKEPRGVAQTTVQRHPRKEFQGRTWSTRKNIHIDRVCSAWLIRRFIDRKAKFVFAAGTKVPKGSVPFDMVDVEFGHHGDLCTFETLLEAFQIGDPVLASIAQIVHDIDLKDQKFGRPEAAGVDMMIRSLSDSLRDDDKVLEIGSVLLDGIYSQLAAGKNIR